MERKILGLDLGTNSIGWAVVNENENAETLAGIDCAGSRIIPMDGDVLSDFDKGNSVSQTNERTRQRSTRRMRERFLLRRERLLRTLNTMGFLPAHFAEKIDRYGKFTTDDEPKLAWRKNAVGENEFIFQPSFDEMITDFSKYQPELLHDGKKVPYDWTIYYLRKKALTRAITKEELAWILLNFNQKRGYYQARDENEEESTKKLEEYKALKVIAVEDSGDNVLLEGDLVYRRTSKEPLDWVGSTKEFIITTELDNNGEPKKDKDGNVKRSIRLPKEDDWTLLKKKTESDINQSHKTVGAFIYDAILQNPNQKINGKLVRTIERKFYKDELRQILDKQKEFIAELNDAELYEKCLGTLYVSNEAHRESLADRDFTHLFLNDILFYQRPLKSKKSLIDDCQFEENVYKDPKTGELKHTPLKCIAKSNPIYQEFRLWQFIANLRILQREKEVNGRLMTDVDVTVEFLPNEESYVALFDYLNKCKEIKQDTLLTSHFKIKKLNKKDEHLPYRWNYVEDKVYPCNETRASMLKYLKKADINDAVLTKETEMVLWHILYSVADKQELERALKTFAEKRDLPAAFAEKFKDFPAFKSDYGAYSEKAIKKLLPLMRMGEYWREEAIDKKTRARIEKIINGEWDESIKNRVREKAMNLTKISDFRGLPLWLACYVVYNRHSEAKVITKWETPDDIDAYLKSFKQHSMRNPIVESVVTETLRTVRDIWKQVGNIDEIHIELGREMKKTAEERSKASKIIQQNENTNLRIKALLQEFKSLGDIERVNPYSPSQQEILRIYEENALENLTKEDKDYDFISKISTSAQPSPSEIVRYKAWLEQKYRSPYTGQIIPLAKLFTSAYEIEHIIPQSLYFDDSFSNKVICEAEVNKLKDNRLGHEFITKNAGAVVTLNGGNTVKILSVEEYEKFVKEHYSRNRKKMKNLLLDEIPDEFIARQMNDSRYISRVVKTLLSNIVRAKDADGEYEQEATSRNLIVCSGSITDQLKKDWGMNDVWNQIVLPRFERLNKITDKNCFTAQNTSGHTIPNMPLELQKGFNKKRIDHRHHAMDAIVIACATRSHVNLLNNEAAKAKDDTKYKLSHKLRRYEKVMINGEERSVPKEFLKPWDTFTQDALRVLQGIVVSFKQNLRIINKTVNHYQHYENGEKVLVAQTKGNTWAIRQSLHKDTVFGEVNLRKIKTVSLNEALKNPKAIVEKDLKAKLIELQAQNLDTKQIKKYFDENKEAWNDVNLSKIEVYYFTKDTNDRYFASRKDLLSIFSDVKNAKKAKETIESITDTGIQKILLAHLSACNDNPEIAFSADGIEQMNRNIVELNGGKNHKPITKVRCYEKSNSKFAVGTTGNKKSKFVEADKGTNLFFAVYEHTTLNKKTNESKKKRLFVTIPLKMVIDCQKSEGKNWLPRLDVTLKENEMMAADAQLLFILSPNDLVYLPTDKELNGNVDVTSIDKSRIYKFVSGSGSMADFIPAHSASTIFTLNKKRQKELFGNSDFFVIQDEYGVGSPKSKNERAVTGEMIKEICLPLKVDRLGNLVEFNGKQL